MDGSVKSGPLELLIRNKFSSKWKPHYFKIMLDGTVQCYEDKTKKPKEVMKKSDIKQVQMFEGRKDSCTQFEVAFYDKKETWMLKASSERERNEWVNTFTAKYEPVQHDQNYQYMAYQEHSIRMQAQHFRPQIAPNQYQQHLPPPYPTASQAGFLVPMPQPSQPAHPDRNSYYHYRTSPRPAQSAQQKTFNYPNCPLPSPPPPPPPANTCLYSQPNADDGGYEVMISPATVQHQYEYVDPNTHQAQQPQQPINIPDASQYQYYQQQRTIIRSPSVASDADSVMSTSDMKQPSSEKNASILDISQEISIDLLTNAEPIGKGNFGQVYKADYKLKEGNPPIKVAVKKLNEAKESASKEMMKEFAVMASMVHPNIVRVYGVVMNIPTNPKIVIEYLPHGDLKTYLKKSPKKPVDTLVKYMIDIAMGMHYIAQKGLIHRDLAARNVLVGEGETCKVSDFGLIKELPSNMSSYQSSTPVPLPIRWMSPEALSRKCFSEASDVWSYGVLQWEMFNPNELPYDSLDNIQVSLQINEGHRLNIPNECPPTVANIMKACWQAEPNQRPNFHEITTILTTKI